MKIAINACYGGFSLSNRAIKAYCDRKGIPCHFFRQDGFRSPYVRISDKEAFSDTSIFGVSAFRCETVDAIPSQDGWHEMTMDQRVESNKAYEAVEVPNCRDLPRDDLDLIAVIEELGESANGQCASLRIVEIPDGVDWEIDEYDGYEHVAEKHRTWA